VTDKPPFLLKRFGSPRANVGGALHHKQSTFPKDCSYVPFSSFQGTRKRKKRSEIKIGGLNKPIKFIQNFTPFRT
jgi:hypothetical protein